MYWNIHCLSWCDLCLTFCFTLLGKISYFNSFLTICVCVPLDWNRVNEGKVTDKRGEAVPAHGHRGNAWETKCLPDLKRGLVAWQRFNCFITVINLLSFQLAAGPLWCFSAVQLSSFLSFALSISWDRPEVAPLQSPENLLEQRLFSDVSLSSSNTSASLSLSLLSLSVLLSFIGITRNDSVPAHKIPQFFHSAYQILQLHTSLTPCMFIYW